MDVRLPPGFHDEGIRAALELRRAVPEVAVLVLSQYAETDYPGNCSPTRAEEWARPSVRSHS